MKQTVNKIKEAFPNASPLTIYAFIITLIAAGITIGILGTALIVYSENTYTPNFTDHVQYEKFTK